MAQYLCVDVGGTQLRAACFSPDSFIPKKIMRSSTQGTKPDEQNDSPLGRLISLIENIWPAQEEIFSISLAAPGLIDQHKGLVVKAPNIFEWNNLPLKQILENHFHKPVLVSNDANMAALGEWKYGAGQGHRHLLYITVSTGIGAGVIINDQLLVGVDGIAAELGHMLIMQDGPLCGCGQHGHLEALASGAAIARWTAEQISLGASTKLQTQKNINTQQIAAAAKEGDQLCKTALARAGYYLGQGLANLLHAFNPSVVIIGGGVSFSGELLIDPLKDSLNKHIMSEAYLQNLTIKPASLGDEAGLIGAFVNGQIHYPASL